MGYHDEGSDSVDKTTPAAEEPAPPLPEGAAELATPQRPRRFRGHKTTGAAIPVYDTPPEPPPPPTKP